jgi:hypothetical protein
MAEGLPQDNMANINQGPPPGSLEFVHYAKWIKGVKEAKTACGLATLGEREGFAPKEPIATGNKTAVTCPNCESAINSGTFLI